MPRRRPITGYRRRHRTGPVTKRQMRNVLREIGLDNVYHFIGEQNFPATSQRGMWKGLRNGETQVPSCTCTCVGHERVVPFQRLVSPLLWNVLCHHLDETIEWKETCKRVDDWTCY